MLIYECLTVVSWNKWLVGVAAALLPVQDTKCIVRSAIRPNLHVVLCPCKPFVNISARTVTSQSETPGRLGLLSGNYFISL